MATGQIVIFEHANFKGAVQIIRDQAPSLDGSLSSFVVIEGKWQFFAEENFQYPYPIRVGPGAYPSTEDLGIKTVRSLKSVG